MKMSNLFVQTLREFPSDAEVVSHKMLVRAGYIRKLSSGIYNYLPLMWRVLKKVETIVREEMDAAGAQEMLMPFVQPKELWEESGRWEVYGKELMRLQDRHERWMCLGPTHEEVITSVARDGIKSYKQMPVNLYQIQSKFRDEVRPRFGLLRGREFIMKDAYSFDVDEAGLDIAYGKMEKAYTRAFERCGLETKMVQSDSGAIGGSVSHEFMVITDTDAGENDVFYCNGLRAEAGGLAEAQDCNAVTCEQPRGCVYAANSNHAVSKLLKEQTDGGFSKAEIIDTPNTKTIAELSEFLKVPADVILKTLVYIADSKPVLAMIRADKEVEETKLMNALGAKEIRIATSLEIEDLMKERGFDAEAGFIGPIEGMWMIADESVKGMKNFVVGANKNDKHLVGANLGVDIPEIKKYADFRLVEAGELCPECGQSLCVTRGIEVGNIFKLGTKYSKPMNAVFLDKDGKTKPYVMGCYGIGISRTAAAAVEAHYDENGIKWPISIAPYHVVIVPVNIQDKLQMEVSEKLYKELQAAGVEVVFDDRDERPGVKFKDADLIGFPYRITVGKTIQEGNVEFKNRSTNEMETIKPEEASAKIIEIVKNI